MQHAYRLFAAIASSAVLGGCSTLDVWSYRPSSLSGTPPGETALALFPGTMEKDSKATRLIKADEEVSRLLKGCTAEPGKAAPPIAPALLPIVAAAVQLGFEAYIDKKRRDVEAIVEASQTVYTINVALSPEELTAAKCLVLVRYTEDEKKVLTEQMTAVLRITTHTAADPAATQTISFRPVFVRAKTAVAATRDSEKPAVTFSFAVSVKAVSRELNQSVSRLTPTGEAAATASEVPLGKVAIVSCTQNECGSSDLLPYPTNRGSLSLSVAVAEKGSTGFSGKAVDAELAAIKGALGPAFGEAVKAKFGQ